VPASPAAPRLYDLAADVGETTDIAAAHPDVVARLLALIGRMNAELAGPAPRGRRPAGTVKNPQTLYPTVPPAPRPQKPKKERAGKAAAIGNAEQAARTA
jgi:hypothetical protein